MLKALIFSSVFLFAACLSVTSQVSEKEFDFLSKYYNDQYKKLIRARGVDTVAYFSSKYINQNQPKKISGILKKYFGENKSNIAALMYFYFDTTFYVFIADKDKVRKLSERKIELTQITDLNRKIINSLKLRKDIKDRAPKIRGVAEADDKEVVDFEKVNAFASKLLIPDSGILNYDHIIIVPCMNLGAFPFYLLKYQVINL